MSSPRTPTARTRFARRAVPVVLVAAALLLVTFSMRAQADVVNAQSAAAETTSSVQVVVARATQPVRDLIGWFSDLRSAKSERDSLAVENAVLRAEIAKAQVDEQDADELRGLLNYVESPAFPETDAYVPHAARVVARSPSLTSSTVVVDAGENAGVQVGDPVLAGVAASVDIGGAALIGKISRVTAGTATVALLSNADVAVGATVAGRRGADGILQPSAADPSVLVLGFVRGSSIVRPGDRVVTSGFLDPTGRLASAYPRGLPIGVVSEARQSDANTYKSVLVVPWVDLGSFANTVILTGGGTS
ncbi:MAG: rod shape-determining protein MreC [Gaiellales bacterium]|jgi:rod shape-determining protein MreC|nr:rod shape-determining protein MreC [Gaiellales bacterium]